MPFDPHDDHNFDHLTAVMARWISIASLPLIAGSIFWVASTVNDSAAKIGILSSNLEHLQANIGSLDQQIDLKFQIRDARLTSIEKDMTGIIQRFDEQQQRGKR